ncbi:MAG: hypothetical protein IKW96_12805 [Ruminococcus sp.]|uniref:hypothetical protein n=1 Tax=Ruminococcus sp. TaxID=41978 RepID=UPI0025D179E9|nr:hypothetical protein [Ruminococcus sp.]MBR5684130.1 hypothetical protein [Ruminococcus sp.]
MKDKDVKKKKKWPKVLLTIAVIGGALTGFIAFNASKNMEVMNRTLDAGMKTLSEYAEVTPVDTGDFSQIKMYGLMKFNVSQYDVSEVGNLSVMTVNMGFMQMVSYVITPYEKNMPLMSMDFMYILGKRKAYAEFYDLVPDRTDGAFMSVLDSLKEFENRYSSLEDITTDPAWYDDLMTVVLHKAGKRADDDVIEEMFCDAIRTYMERANELEELSDAEKAEKLALTREYSDNLISKGGVSTDVFKKALGEDKTKEFFDKVFFGTERRK